MALSWDEAVAHLTGPGGPFAIIRAVVNGQTLKVFERTPPSLRQLFETARERGERTFLVYEDERWSFARVMEHVDALGALLVDRYRIRRGDRVAIAMRNYPEWIVAFAAITSIGAVAVSLNAWWQAEELHYGLRDSGARLLIGDEARVQRAARALAQLGIPALVARCTGALPPGAERLEASLPLGAALPEVEIAPDDDATILYTSGTTGVPKGAVSTQIGRASCRERV